MDNRANISVTGWQSIWAVASVVVIMLGILLYQNGVFSEPVDTTAYTSGVRGVVLLGPSCPVVRLPKDPECIDRPYHTTLVVTTPDGARIVKQFESGIEGVFVVGLQPGTYAIRSSDTANLRSFCSLSEPFAVRIGEYTTVTINCDTGIR